ncbi:phosphomannomutase [Cohaesibacter celericrescens]|uniref:Phosphomannomutase n=1 Tax=Cohaesibacter celericrescens TaxID=2067669 RepID=A0A2N5XJU8_9HYPH|nr:phosphomannomutase [Cohaesibacter celericrescens]PLW74801.1 phosphomannomutase [Cohaesibacter celericrescens]
MSVKFGTSGLRGLSSDLVGMPTALYLTAFCRYLEELGLSKRGNEILVGKDFRASSPDISKICFGAIEDAGFRPVDCGALPTPALALAGMKAQVASVMITGSHIPADRNGIKFYLPAGEISKQDEVAISVWAEKLSDSVVLRRGECAVDNGAASKAFLARNNHLLPNNALSGLKIGVYQHSTVGRDLLVDTLAHYGAEVVSLGRSDEFIPVDTEAVSTETIALLQGWAIEYQLDAIVSADGDADRPLVADEAGIPLRGDLLGLVTATFLDANVVVTPVTSNSGIEKNGSFEVKRTCVGSPFVIAGMDDAIAQGKSGIVGFEANGGFLTASSFQLEGLDVSPLPTRDCFLPILSTLYVRQKRSKPLSLLARDYSLPVAAAERISNYSLDQSAALMKHLRASDENLSAFLSGIGKVASTSDLDGLRVYLQDGRVIHFRPSGNAPEMRCYVEAKTESAAHETLKQGLTLIEQFSWQ